MALKGTKRSNGAKAFISLIIVVGTVAVGGIIAFMEAMLARLAGVQAGAGQDIVTRIIVIASLVVAAFVIWMVWPDQTPEQAAMAAEAERLAVEKQKTATPRFDEQVARDAAARAAFMAEPLDISEEDGDAVARDWDAVNADFNSALATDLRRRR